MTAISPLLSSPQAADADLVSALHPIILALNIDILSYKQDENKYKRRSAFTLLSRWLRPIQGHAGRRRALTTQKVMMGLVVSFLVIVDPRLLFAKS